MTPFYDRNGEVLNVGDIIYRPLYSGLYIAQIIKFTEKSITLSVLRVGKLDYCGKPYYYNNLHLDDCALHNYGVVLARNNNNSTPYPTSWPVLLLKERNQPINDKLVTYLNTPKKEKNKKII